MRTNPRDSIWPPPALDKQVICIFCNGRLCYPKSVIVAFKGQITQNIKNVMLEYTLVCASCRREFLYHATKEVVEVPNGE